MAVDKAVLKAYSKYGKKSKTSVGKKSGGGSFSNLENASEVLMSAYNCWMSLNTFREQMRRHENFIFGDQWLDNIVLTKDDRRYITTERAAIVEQGQNPSQYNILRNIIRTIVGIYASNRTMPVCVAQKADAQAESDMLTVTLQSLYRQDEIQKLNISELEQLLITGVAVVRQNFTTRKGNPNVYRDFVNPYSFFVDNTMEDPRYTDCSIVGCYYDLSLRSIISRFTKGDKVKKAQIQQIYGNMSRERIFEAVETFTDERLRDDFLIPPIEKSGLCRVFEIWRKEMLYGYQIHDYLHGRYYFDEHISEKELEAINASRIAEYTEMGVLEEDMLLMDYEYEEQEVWVGYYLAPSGAVLLKHTTPFWHEETPFDFELHTFFLGKIYPFVKDLIDSQKEINQIATTVKFLTRYSAKDLLFFPEDQLPDSMDLDDIAEQYTSYNGMILYKPKQGATAKPEHISTISQAFQPLQAVNIYLSLSEKISGVYGALQGAQPTAGTPAQMYAQQTQNSATSLIGVLTAINSFVTRCDKKAVQLMQQYYDSPRYIYDSTSGKPLVFEPTKVRDIDFEITITENTETPAYRLMLNDLLFQLKQFDTTNMLDLRGLVEAGNLPFKDKILNYLNKREQELADMQEGDPIPPVEMING